MKLPLSPIARHKRLQRIWQDPPSGPEKIFCAVNHTTIGLRFIMTALAFFLVGGVLAMLIRAQLATPNNAFAGPEIYNQIFTMHGTVMMFLFAIPMLEGIALYLLPKMMGARDLAFPRLGAYAYWCYVFGGGILLVAMVFGVAPDSGWFMYVPLAGSTYTPGINADIWLIGITFAEISAICGAVELVVSILRMRTPGMGLGSMPLFAWYMLVTAGMILIGFPPLILASILLEIERAFGWPFFDVSRGGDSLLWQHLFWMFGHPEVYIIFLPAAGLVSTMIPVFARRPIIGYTWVVASVLAIGFVSFGLWAHHMYTVGLPYLSQMFFSAASMLVAIPTALQFFIWIATLWAGRPVWRLPMLYLAGFLAIFVLGGLTGVMIALAPFDWQVHDTHFIVAHMHYVLIGGMVYPVMAAVYFWMPHVTGRMPSETLGRWAFWLTFVGFNLTFLVMHLTGLLGMPRRIYAYDSGLGWDLPNLLSSVGAFIQAIGFALLILDVLIHARTGRIAPRNPWGADTLEWATATPVAPYNFGAQAYTASRTPLWDAPDLGARLAGGTPFPGSALPTRRETISVEVLTGTPQSLTIVPGPSWLPIIAAVATGVFFLAVLFKVYGLAVLGALAATGVFLYWAWTTGARHDPEPVAVGLDLHLLPHHALPLTAPGRSGVLFALVADATLLASLLFGYAFLWSVAPNWPPPRYIATQPALPLLGLAGLTAATLATRWALRSVHDARLPAARLRFWLATAAGAVAAMVFALLPSVALPPATSHAYAAISAVICYYISLHAGVGALLTGYSAARCRAGFVSPVRHLEPLIARIWWNYTFVTGVAATAALYLLPWSGS